MMFQKNGRNVALGEKRMLDWAQLRHVHFVVQCAWMAPEFS